MVRQFGASLGKVREQPAEDNETLKVEIGVQPFPEVMVDSVRQEVDDGSSVSSVPIDCRQKRWTLSTQSHRRCGVAEQLCCCSILHEYQENQ